MVWLFSRASSHKRKTSAGSFSVTELRMEEQRGGALEPPRAGHQLHPRLWLALGISYIGIGVVELCLAALWRFWLGVALGFGIAKMGMSLCGMTLASRPPPPPARGCLGWIKNLGRRGLMWGASKVQALFFFFRWLIYAYGAVVFLMLLIHVASPEYRWAGFPNECPADKRFGCSRIAESNPHNARHLLPLHLNAALDDVQAQVERWVQAQPQSHVLGDSRRAFVHARILTLFWGFADDMMISLRCNEEQQTVIEVQGQLRLGKSDFGVNSRRNERFLVELSQAAQAGDIPVGLCTDTATGLPAAGG